MTHATKKILALVLTLALCLSLVVAGIPAFAEDEPTLTIASVEAAPGADAVVAVTATDLPLQGGTEFILNLAEGLTFVSLTATDRALVENNDYSINGNAIKVLGLYGFDNEDLPAVLTLTVKVSDDAEAGSYPITATNVILADGDENLLDPVITGGGVTVVVDEVHEHNYGEWEFDANEHWKTCTSEVGDCDAPVSYRANHEWGDGVVTTAPTVLEAGVRTFTCECGAEKTEEEPKLTAPTTDDDVATVVETDEEIIVDAGDADTVTLTDVIAVAGDKAVAVKTATADIVFEGIEATDEVAFNVVKTEDAEIAGKTGTNFAFTMNNATFINATITVEYPVTANTKLYHIYGDPVQAEEIVFTDNGDGTATFELPHFSSVLFEEVPLVVYTDYAADIVIDRFDHAKCQVVLGYKTSTDADFNKKCLSPYKTGMGRDIEVVLSVNGDEHAFRGDGLIKTSYKYLGIVGYTVDDMAADIQYYVRVTYYENYGTDNAIRHMIYSAPVTLCVNDYISNLTDDASVAYNALIAARTADVDHESSVIATDESDAVIKVSYALSYKSGGKAQLLVDYRGGTDASKPFRTALKKSTVAEGREVYVVLSIDGAEHEFITSEIKTDAFRTIGITGFTIPDYCTEAEVFLRVYHYGRANQPANYSDSSNSVTFTVGDCFENGTSDLFVAMNNYMDLVYGS